MLAAAAFVLLAACGTPPSEEELALQRAVDRARERNAVAGAAVALLVTLALRHLVRWVSARRAARRAARAGWAATGPVAARPVPPWLLAAAVATEMLSDAVLLGSGALLGYALGPTPGPEGTFEGTLLWVVVVFVLGPIALALTVVAIVVQGLAARLAYAGTPTLVVLAVPHAAVVLLATRALAGSDDGVHGATVAVLAVGVTGTAGFVTEVVRRVRARRGPGSRDGWRAN